MSDSDLFPSSSSDKPWRKKSGSPLATLAIMLGFTIIGGLVGKACGQGLARFLLPSRQTRTELPRRSVNESPQALTEAVWKTHSPEGLQMSLELPGDPKPGDGELPADLKKNLVHFEGYELKQTGLQVMVSHVEYVPMNIVISAEGSVRGLVQSFWQTPGVTDFQSSINNTSPSETKFSVSFVRNQIEYKADGFARTADFKLWNVICIVESRNANAELAAKRILNSVVTK